LIDKRQARRRALRHLVSRLFEGSPALLVLNVLEDDGIDPVERQQLRRLIEQA
jgi:predicted transcriptional regulator